MAREPKTIQDDPTKPRAEAENGLQLDDWGLPLAGPARQAALAELNKPDPNIEPDAWRAPTKQTAAAAAEEN